MNIHSLFSALCSANMGKKNTIKRITLEGKRYYTSIKLTYLNILI